jgi:hypothetical protein
MLSTTGRQQWCGVLNIASACWSHGLWPRQCSGGATWASNEAWSRVVTGEGGHLLLNDQGGNIEAFNAPSMWPPVNGWYSRQGSRLL